MNNTKHTPGPWKAREFRGYHFVVDQNECAICETNITALPMPMKANMERIVACVNHCEGFSNADLHAGGAMTARKELDKLLAQRDELLAALKDRLDFMQSALPAFAPGSKMAVRCAHHIKETRAAIAKVQK